MAVDDIKSSDHTKMSAQDGQFITNDLNAQIGGLSDSFLESTVIQDKSTVRSSPVHLGFLVSFLVDARGGSMRGCRHSGCRIMVPPKSCAQPTRITCRYVKPQRVHNPPPLMEGEALVSRILEMSPVEAVFLGPIILEVPHFGTTRNDERELIILRSDNGETWREHTYHNSENGIQEILYDSLDGIQSPLEDLHTDRIMRIVTRNLPHFFAVVSRIRQEIYTIGPEGGSISSQVVPNVKAIFPIHALTKNIRVGLQAQPINLQKFTNDVTLSSVVTIEPRRRKFHKAITLCIPTPKVQKEVENPSPSPSLRLLCSITGGQNRAVWEDVTGSTPLTFSKDSVTFTTTVSARFWLIDCPSIANGSKIASEVYTKLTLVPFMVRFVVFAKRISVNESKFSIFCLTENKEDKTLDHHENLIKIACSADVEVFETENIYLQFSGDLVPVVKSSEQLKFQFQAFHENRLSFFVRWSANKRNPWGRLSFVGDSMTTEAKMRDICSLDAALDGQRNSPRENITWTQGINYRNLLNAGYKTSENKTTTCASEIVLSPPSTATILQTELLCTDNLKNNTSSKIYSEQHVNSVAEGKGVENQNANNKIVGELPGDFKNIKNKLEANIGIEEKKKPLNDHQILNVLKKLGHDWVPLGNKLGVPECDMEFIHLEYPNQPDKQVEKMMQIWLQNRTLSEANETLSNALRSIGRGDVYLDGMKMTTNEAIFLEEIEETVSNINIKPETEVLGKSDFLDKTENTLVETREPNVERTDNLQDTFSDNEISTLHITQPNDELIRMCVEKSEDKRGKPIFDK